MRRFLYRKPLQVDIARQQVLEDAEFSFSYVCTPAEEELEAVQSRAILQSYPPVQLPLLQIYAASST